MHTLSAILAISWNPEIRGLTTVAIGVGVLCGSVYLLLGTNLGARLGFLVALAGLFGWMTLMGIIWWIYGIGYLGRGNAWIVKEIVLDGDLTSSSYEWARTGRIDEATLDQRVDGWIQVAEEDAQFGQVISAADEVLVVEAGIFDDTTQYQAIAVFDKGGDRWPLILGREEMDLFAFRHDPHYAIAVVQPVVPQREETGRAAADPVIDETANPVFVLMIRDLGSRRQPAIALTVGSGIVFLWASWRLHERDKLLAKHLANPNPVPATVEH
jgi:hypothetical protein